MKINHQLQHRLFSLLLACLVFLAGRVSWQLQIHWNLPPVQPIAEVNPGVPLVTILDIKNGQLIASSNRPEIRLVSGEEVAVPDEDLRLQLDLSHLGFLGERRPVLVHQVPEWARYVASKNGKYAYQIDEKSAKNLSVPNRVYFQDDIAAMAAGYQIRDRN